MPPVAIPYARQQAYDNSDYVRTMAQLMLQDAERQQQLRLARGANSQQMWQGLGQTAMVTMGSMLQSRDEQQKLKALQAERDREYALKQQEMRERKAEREADLAYRNRMETRQADLDRDKRAEEETSLTPVGDVIPMSQFRQSSIPGSPSTRAFRPQAYEAARLPATPFIESGGIPSYTTPIPVAGGVPQAGGGDEEYLTGPTQRTMSPDTAERPEGMRRIPSQQEAVALEGLDRQDRALRLQIENTRIDNDRQLNRDQQLARQYADTAAATKAYRDARLSQGGAPTTAKLAVAAANGDTGAQAALDIIRQTETRADNRDGDKFFTLSGEFQKEPMVKAADRTVILDDAIKNVRANPSGAPGQLALSYAFVQVVDTYQSAVREGELRNIGILDSDIDRWKKALSGVVNRKQLVSPALALEIADTSERMVRAIEQAKENKAADYRRRAGPLGITDLWDQYYQPTTRLTPDQMPGAGGGGSFFDRQQPSQPVQPFFPNAGQPPRTQPLGPRGGG